TTVVSRHPADFNISVINTPEKVTLRAVPDGLGLYSTAPEGKLKDFLIGAPSFLLVNESTILSLKAVDEYDNPVDAASREISWKVNNDTAVVEKNKLTAMKPGNANIEIETDQIKKQLDVEIVCRDQIAQLDLGLNSLLLNPGDVFSLTPSVTTKNGQTRQVSPSLFNWEWIGVQGGYKEGDNLHAGTSPGSGWLVGSYDRFSSMIPVQIGTTNQVIMDFEKQPNLSFQGTPKEVTGEFVLSETEKKEGKYSGALTYDFSQATADTQAAYGQINAEGISFSGTAKGITVWVYGDANNYWLRGEIVDQNGQIQYLTLADKVNWSGWKEISVDFPQAIEKPVLKRIYLVNLKSSSDQKKAQGKIYLDKISYKTTESKAVEADVQVKLFANEKKMLINEKEQVIDQGPIIEQGRSYIPARFLIEALGGKVFWDASDKRVRILLGNNMIDLWVNDKEHTIVNGVNKTYDTAPIIRNNRTLIPVRMVTENLGYQVNWLKGEITINE
ncbi:MAG: copper amine oxidase N-terminal domain-containing protein, partial [Dehalobacterium sp.]